MTDKNGIKERLARVEEHCEWTRYKLSELNEAHNQIVRDGQKLHDEIGDCKIAIAQILEGQKTLLKVIAAVGTIVSILVAIFGFIIPFLP